MSNQPRTEGSDEPTAARPAIYPMIDPSRPIGPLLAPFVTPSGIPLCSPLTPEEQRAEWLAEQEKKRVEREKAEQARKAKE